MIGIYKITNLVNNKVYIGKSSQLEKRKYQHFYDSFYKNVNNRNYNMTIHKAIRKYGKENFSFDILEICDINKLDQKEQYWISYYNSKCSGYNESDGGEGVVNLNRELIFSLWDEGKSITQICQQTNYSKGGVQQALKNYKNYSIEESQKRRAQSRNKQVIQLDLQHNPINSFNSIKEASQKTGIRADSISATCRKKQKTSGGFIWRFREEEVLNNG